MIRIFFLSILVSVSVFGYENTPLVKCELHYKKMTVELILDAVGKSFLRMGPKDNCDIKLNHISGSPRAQIPGYLLSWNVFECHGQMKEFKKDILDKMTMNIKLLTPKPTGSVQWLRAEDVEDCIIDKFRGEELQQAINDLRKLEK